MSAPRSVPFTTPPPSPTAEQAPDRLTQVTLLLLSTLTIMSGATIAPALPAMQAHFADAPNAAFLVKLSLTIVGLAIALTAPLSGVLADRYGRRPVLLVSLVLYALGGGVGLIADSIGSLLAGRIVLGLAVAGTMTAAGALVNDLFSGPARGKFLSQQAAFGNFGGAVLMPLGGLLAAASWRAPFALYLISLLLIPLTLRLRGGLPAPLTGGADLTARPHWGRIGLIYALSVGYMIVFYLMPTQGPFLLGTLGAAPAVTGLLLGAFTLVAALTSLAYSRFTGRFHPQRAAALGLGLLAAGWLTVSGAASPAGALLGLILGGLGGGLVFPNLYTWLADLTPPAWRGRVTAGMSSAIFLGQFLSPVLLTSQPGHEGLIFRVGALLAGLLGAALLAFSLRRAPPARTG
ncbi:MFS transporter [Deinococcus sp. RIT780]|uniref:MFS transporter n=1 Tax=Deinococcus sp. RIT780 TaxID=2870472 RepID=UPI001C89A19E|nr:MFS transporter [Deinococcus sp. RIT780]MBX8467137.1 MFS transporter [Deinococcus sp. RIT780]